MKKNYFYEKVTILKIARNMGNIRGNMNYILLNVGYSELNANWNWENVYSPFARIYYVKTGNAKTLFDNQVFELSSGNMYLTPPFTLHNDECDSPFSLYYIHFFEETINNESIFDKYNFPVSIKASKIDLLLVQRLLEINPDRHLKFYDPKIYDNTPTFTHFISDNNKLSDHTLMETRGILIQLMSRFTAEANIKTDNKDIRIIESLKHIHENIDKEISVATLADISCITSDHFIRLFKREMNITPLKYILTKKIEKSQLMLLTTDISIKEIAWELSIENVSYFNRIFKKHTGKTPGAYRFEYGK